MSTDIIITGDQIPSIPGIDQDDLHLAATIAATMYDNKIASWKQLQTKLEAIPSVHAKYPNLEAQFYYQDTFVGAGLPINNPPFTAIITDTDNPETMILAWRGSMVAKDWIQNLRFLPTDTKNIGSDVQVQSAYYELIQKYFAVPPKTTGKGRDLKKLVETGNKTPNKKGTPIKRIILTGHSLGGGLAQVAHQVLKAESSDFSKAIKDNNVEVHTIAFSSQMTIAAPDSYKIENMTNIVLQDDLVPRLYGNEVFIRNFLDALGETLDMAGQKPASVGQFINIPGILSDAYKYVHSILEKVLDYGSDVLGMYRHVGRIVYYATPDAKPKIYNNETFKDIQKPVGAITTENAESYHMNTVTGPGLAWAN